MALSLSFLLLPSLLFLTQLSSFVSAAPWIVTEDFQEVITTETYYHQTITTTLVEQITPTASSIPEAISTATSTGTSNYDYYYYDNSKDVTIVQQLYPTGVGSVVDEYDYGYGYYDDDDDDAYHSTVFAVNITYTAPTGCSSQWTRTSAVRVTPPSKVQDLLPRTAVTTSFSVDSSRPFQPTTYTIDIVYVDPTQVPSSTLSSLSTYNRPTSLYTGAGCTYTGPSGGNTNPGNYGYPTYGSNGGYTYYDYGYGEESWFLDSYPMGISPLALTLILSIGWIGLFLILGFIEAWVRFRRLMLGWQTRRGLPVCWSLTIMPITLLLLCFFRKGYRSRSQADGEVLRKRWNAMSFWTKLRLYFVWGFRFKYPPMLGPAPARVKTSKQPEKHPGPRLLEPSPASSVAPQSRQGSSAAPAAAADPEMAMVPPVTVDQPHDRSQEHSEEGSQEHHQENPQDHPQEQPQEQPHVADVTAPTATGALPPPHVHETGQAK
ncbi:hypothetical protein BO94DRAFT_540503 [Aspergillus sclerotioniger CBS 115572]|uniref:Uncharacterized protein n=1 Tax=Aspergillus sclerotioniger CBS 115572 TaxID=1450535 RepID=A0A317UYE2_9EURO|nr:hypothetical protein BO94DRAFT_540503 [Aspergillus sclerotioniger CBS 115572]PWY67074.1 hypothetical protein BO94DRAFT_540503 [Aspergillus sclerotioniger CBS 115572]